MSFDVLVVGAGPAGSVAATVLARAGARVCLIDRASFPRPKLCGDTLNPGALGILRRLGLACGAERQGLTVEGMRVTGDGVAVEGRYPGALRGLAVRREDLDWSLLNAATAAGVEFRELVTARAPVVRDGRHGSVVAGASCLSGGSTPFEVTAPVTIAADGRRSALAFALGLARHPPAPRRCAVGLRATGVYGLSALGEMHIRRGHYIGIAPLSGNVANVCLVRPVASGDTSLGDPLAALTKAIEAEPLLRDRFANATFIDRPLVLGPLGVDLVSRRSPPNGLLLAGDAAGFIDPMTGDGLRFALRGGELAAHAALSALEHGWDDVQAALAVTRQREFGSKWRFNRILRGLVGSPSGVRAATAGGRLAPAIVRALIVHASDCHLAAAH